MISLGSEQWTQNVDRNAAVLGSSLSAIMY